MIRYTKQNDKYSCGPTAIINVLKWAGYSVPYREYKKEFNNRCSCGPRTGTAPWHLDFALNNTKEVAVKRMMNNPTLSDLNFQLRKDRAVIIRFGHPGGGHYALCIKETNKFYLTVNYFKNGKAVRYVSKRKMRNDLKRSRLRIGYRDYSVMWAVEGVGCD